MPRTIRDMLTDAEDLRDDLARLKELRDRAHLLAVLVLNATDQGEVTDEELRKAANGVEALLCGPGVL